MMIVAVDPNKEDLKLLVKSLRMVFPTCEVAMFSDPESAAAYIQNNPIDALYTEVDMLKVSGFNLQLATEAVQPAVLTVFVTATADYVAKAIQTRVQDYILKPFTEQEIQQSMNGTKFGTVTARG